MKRSTGAVILLLSLVGVAAAHGQERSRVVVAPGLGHRGGGRVEQVLRLRSELNLSQSQTSQLDAIRREEVARRQEHSRDLIELQSQFAAGQITEREFSRRTRELRAGEETRATNQRDRINRILTLQQRDRLDDLRLSPRVIRRVVPAAELRLRQAERRIRSGELRIRRRELEERIRSVPRIRPHEEVRERIEQLRRRREGIL